MPRSTNTETTRTPRRAGGGRGGVRTAGRGGAGTVHQLPYQQVRNNLPLIEFLPEAGIERIHQASMRILSEIGIEVLYPPARDYYKSAGCKIEGQKVFFDPEAVMEYVSKAPEKFSLTARNPERNVMMGDRYITAALMGSAPNCSDMDHGRRPGNKADFIKLLKLGHSVNAVNVIAGYPVEPIDIPADIRHLEALRLTAIHTDRVFNGYCLGPQRARDAMEIARLANGVSNEEFERNHYIFSVINTNSPLRLDNPMANGIIEFAKRNQVTCITPFTLAGAMAPVTLAAALSQQNAEGLAGVMLSQIVRPGAPIIFGSFTSNVDMRSGAPAFGTPEYTKSALISGQLARRYKLPFRTSNANASNAPDGQAVYESMMALWGSFMGGVNLLKHGLGWLEGGLVCNFEKIILDAEMVQGMYEFLKPIGLEDSDFGFDAINDVGAGGHFFGSPHTMERYESAFYSPLLSDWRNFETWREAGAKDATQRANEIWKSLLENYESPAMDSEHLGALNDFVDRRIKEGGAPGM
ncbi:MAG: trimethylamine methyltransferase family protein [Alphaproteobacteria bacterium]